MSRVSFWGGGSLQGAPLKGPKGAWCIRVIFPSFNYVHPARGEGLFLPDDGYWPLAVF